MRRLAAFALVLTPLAVAGCGPGRVDCSLAPRADVIVGTAVARRGSTVTFVVASVRRNPDAVTTSGFGGPRLRTGERIAVRYDQGSAQFLRIGSRYQVYLWWASGSFWSEVHTANHACSGGTVYANGAAIDTSLWSRSWVRNTTFVFALIVAIGLAVAAAWAFRRGRRRRARRHGLRRVGQS